MGQTPKRGEFVALMEAMGWDSERLKAATVKGSKDAKAFVALLNAPSATQARATFRAAVREAHDTDDKTNAPDAAAGLLALFPE